MKKIIVFFLAVILFLSDVYSQELKDRLTLSGSIFTDFFYNVDNSIDSLRDVNGYRITRIFFTTDFIISQKFEGRFRLESNQSSSTLTAGGKIGVMVKDAFLRWKNIFEGSDLIFGLSPTPIYETSEFWGYRCLEKSPTDLLGIIPFRDLGADLRGKLTQDGMFNYHIKIGNNSNNAPEINKYKRYYAMINYKSPIGIQIGLYGDYASAANKFDRVDRVNKNNDQIVGSVFLIYSNPENYSLGANSFYRNIRNNFSPSTTQTLNDQNGIGYSLWAWYKLSEKFRLVGRLDRFDPNTDCINDSSLLSILGVDYRPAEKVNIIPNIEVVSYEGKDHQDFTARVTFAFQF